MCNYFYLFSIQRLGYPYQPENTNDQQRRDHHMRHGRDEQRHGRDEQRHSHHQQQSHHYHQRSHSGLHKNLF